MTDISHDEIIAGFKQVQDHIAQWVVETGQGQMYLEDNWDYAPKGDGGGRTRVWEGKPGQFMEKGGVNFSAIGGKNLPAAALNNMAKTLGEQKEVPFFATGVSLVFHPANPNVPTIHMNIRYFEAGTNWWFGGGIDLTPYYPNVDQVIGFHKTLKEVCDRHGQPYQEYKEECDKYFFLKHRGETRGVGGIFFEYLRTDKRKMFEFVKDVGMTLTKAYAPIAIANKDLPFTAEMREFQLLRRSRYVEFNLLFDRGTKFGIESDGRTESILMSLPTVAKWKYSFHPAEGTLEHKFISNYLKPQEWLSMSDEEKQKIRLHVIAHVKNQNSLIKKLKLSQSQSVTLIAGALLGVAGTLAFLKFSKKE